MSILSKIINVANKANTKAQEIGSTIFKEMVDLYKGQNPSTEKAFYTAICQLVSIQLLNAGYEKFIFKKIEDKGWNKTANALRTYNKANTYLGIGLVGVQFVARLEAAKSLAAENLIMSDDEIVTHETRSIDESAVPAEIVAMKNAMLARKAAAN